ncbi:MAG: efflux RND transporter permease subunit [Candidatus Acidulodesulfobacterium acidiphilum]|uniref:Efflux RND transporter permease subunit n=1 Tax=Candidatus Acidulodesulfobacterium acidiphilum TaxID=2597224 RepID=A0A520X9D7_9DELT|nr:MAG: efflux RND transporter permease subunit [Candidatus Acidulodesulfobacterium acidiphilum]
MNKNFSAKITEYFIENKITLLLILFIIGFGIIAVMLTPRQYNPQIIVPAANVIVRFPGASAEQVKNLVTKPLERKMWQIPGVKHVYSISMNSESIVTVQFHVNASRDKSLVDIYNKVFSNLDEIPKGVMRPLIKPIDVNHVPILNITLWSKKYDAGYLTTIAGRILDKLDSVEGTGVTSLNGARYKQLNVYLNPVKMAAYNVSPLMIAQELKNTNVNMPAGFLRNDNKKTFITAGGYFHRARSVKNFIISVYNGRPVYLKDVAKVKSSYKPLNFLSEIGFGGYYRKINANDRIIKDAKGVYPAVTIAIAKRRGKNAVTVVDNVLAKFHKIAETSLPAGVHYTITRNDGKKANNAVNKLLFHLIISIIIVIVLLLLILGWREAFIVAFTIPLMLFLTLGIAYIFHQTLNRITLFALILSLGLLVDNAIVVIDNIERVFSRERNVLPTYAVDAVNEIGNPNFFATLAVIASFIPMLFVTGMMGPYMRPIPFNVPIAMLVSLFVALTIVPWFYLKLMANEKGMALLRKKELKEEGKDVNSGLYARILKPLLSSKKKRYIFMSVIIILFILAMSLPVLKIVKFKMLPVANTNTFLITVNKRPGSTFESTNIATMHIVNYLKSIKQVKNYVITVGTPSVIDFSGLLRGANFRNTSWYSEIRVNLINKDKRSTSSHQLVLNILPVVHKIGKKYDADVKVLESPPGPPVKSTIVAEIYGNNYKKQEKLSKIVEARMKKTRGVTDVNSSYKKRIRKIMLIIRRRKAALMGITTQMIAQSVYILNNGMSVGTIHKKGHLHQDDIFLRMPDDFRTDVNALSSLWIYAPYAGRLVPLNSVVKIKRGYLHNMIYQRDLKSVVYVYGKVVKRSPMYANLDLFLHFLKHPLPTGYRIRWGGEWHLTLKVFAQLGAAMGIAILLIYILLVGYTGSFIIPLILMGAIPLEMIGIMPGFGLIGVYFTATSMIGAIALSGIVIRNSLLLLEFINDRKKEGYNIIDSLVAAGSMRARPIIITALAVVFGSAILVTDPVWNGLAWALIFGMIASTTLTLIVIPVLYYMIEGRRWHKEDIHDNL